MPTNYQHFKSYQTVLLEVMIEKHWGYSRITNCDTVDAFRVLSLEAQTS